MNASRPRPIPTQLLLACSLVLLLLPAACGGDGGSSGGSGRSGAKKDRGEAAMTIGGAAWQGSNASAQIDGEKLTIKASHTDVAGGTASRQELHLLVTDYRGAGDYQTALTGSRFLAVGFDTKKAEGGDQAATDALTSALQGATHMTLAGAKVTVASADGAEVVGTFSWQPPPGSKQPAITDGTFRAKVK